MLLVVVAVYTPLINVLLCMICMFQLGQSYFSMPNSGGGYILLNSSLDYESLYENSATEFSVVVTARVSYVEYRD